MTPAWPSEGENIHETNLAPVTLTHNHTEQSLFATLFNSVDFQTLFVPLLLMCKPLLIATRPRNLEFSSFNKAAGLHVDGVLTLIMLLKPELLCCVLFLTRVSYLSLFLTRYFSFHSLNKLSNFLHPLDFFLLSLFFFYSPLRFNLCFLSPLVPCFLSYQKFLASSFIFSSSFLM